jgi:hypothetical protein
MHLVVGRGVRRAITAAAVAAFLAGCSGGGSPSALVPNSSGATSAQVRANMTAADGRAPIAKTARHAAKAVRPTGDAITGKGIIYWGSYANNSVTIFKSKGINGPELGTITTGISSPERLFVDGALKLWVTNIGNNTVTAYPAGATAPSITISNGVNSPTGLVVGSNGTVYVANVGSDTVTEYHRGKTKPAVTIALGTLSPENLAVDAANNLYISYLGGPHGTGVIEVPAGQSSGSDLNLNVGDAGAIEVDKAGNIVLVDGGVPAVDIFPPGQTNPSKSIPITDGSPFEISMNKAETKLYASVEVGITFDIESAGYPGGTKFTDKITENNQDWPVAVSPDNSI